MIHLHNWHIITIYRNRFDRPTNRFDRPTNRFASTTVPTLTFPIWLLAGSCMLFRIRLQQPYLRSVIVNGYRTLLPCVAEYSRLISNRNRFAQLKRPAGSIVSINRKTVGYFPFFLSWWDRNLLVDSRSCQVDGLIKYRSSYRFNNDAGRPNDACKKAILNTCLCVDYYRAVFTEPFLSTLLIHYISCASDDFDQ